MLEFLGGLQLYTLGDRVPEWCWRELLYQGIWGPIRQIYNRGLWWIDTPWFQIIDGELYYQVQYTAEDNDLRDYHMILSLPGKVLGLGSDLPYGRNIVALLADGSQYRIVFPVYMEDPSFQKTDPHYTASRRDHSLQLKRITRAY